MRVYYLQRFPPANGSTTAPSSDMPAATPEQLAPDRVSRATVESICFGTGLNAGRRRWGRDNLPTTSINWFTNIFIGDQLKIVDGREGILPGRVPFDHTTPIIPGSESWALTLQCEFNSKVYKAYMTTQPMPQVALDVLLVLKVAGKYWIKLLRRGSDPNTVDSPHVLMSGAGEHLEPGTSTPKQDIERALEEESGFDPKDYHGVQIVELATFSDPERDPRYTVLGGFDELGNMVRFGEVRGSSTTLKLVFVEFGGDKLPVIKPHTDLTEVQYTFWCELDEAIAMNPSEFLIEENHSYMQIAKNWLTQSKV